MIAVFFLNGANGSNINSSSSFCFVVVFVCFIVCWLFFLVGGEEQDEKEKEEVKKIRR